MAPVYVYGLAVAQVQSLELLKKYGSLQTRFPDMEKVSKKSGINGK